MEKGWGWAELVVYFTENVFVDGGLERHDCRRTNWFTHFPAQLLRRDKRT